MSLLTSTRTLAGASVTFAVGRTTVGWTRILHGELQACEEGVFAFLDGTARRFCKPTLLEHLVYNGYYKYHGLKFVRALI